MSKKMSTENNSGSKQATTGRMAEGVTVNEDEVAFFARIADQWWDENGPFRPLHLLNPTRLAYIRAAINAHTGTSETSLKPFEGIRILDIGCGGGLLSEPLCRLGASVTGVDASERNIEVAKIHATRMGLTIDYRNTTAEALAEAGEQFDVVVNMEVVEHVADVPAYLAACRALVKPGGLMLMSTLNRTARSFIFAIVGAEYVLRWLPIGAHDWNKFLTPRELADALKTAGFTPEAPTGFVFNPLTGNWKLSDRDVAVNYAMGAVAA